MRQQSGFTLVELITIMVIVGILAVVAAPRLANSDYRGYELRDRTVSALRYAQKTAVSHRRKVCVTYTNTTLTLSIDANNDNAACEQALLLPGSSTAVVQSGDSSKAYFSPLPSDFNFNSDGTSTGATISIPGQSDIVVVGATGHVS